MRHCLVSSAKYRPCAYTPHDQMCNNTARHYIQTHAHRNSQYRCIHISTTTTLPAVLLNPNFTVLVDSFSSVTVDFAVLFVMPVMGRMSDQDTSVRLAASMCFAQLIPLAALKVSDTPLHLGVALLVVRGWVLRSFHYVHVTHLAFCIAVFQAAYCYAMDAVCMYCMAVVVLQLVRM